MHSQTPAERDKALAMLNGAHTFPCPFVFKAIGQNAPTFPAELMQAAVLVLGPRVQPQVSLRESKQSRHVAVTLTLSVERAEQVLDVYAALSSVRGLHMLL